MKKIDCIQNRALKNISRLVSSKSGNNFDFNSKL